MISHSRARRQLGVTMIELMVTVAIIAILAAIALPSFSSSIERQRLRLVVETVVSDFRQARSTAEAQGARGSSTIEFSVNGGDATIWSYTVSNTMSGTLVSRSSSEFTGSPAIVVSNFGDNDSDGDLDVIFTAARGLDPTGDGAVQLTVGGNAATISRNLLGLVSVCSSSGLGYSSCGS